MEDKKIQSLKKEIAKMEASYEKSSTPQSVKNILKKSIDAAKGRLAKMEAKPEPKKEEPKSEPAKPKAKRKPSTALSKLIRRTKSKGYEPYKGKKIDLVRDAGKKAKAPGKKVSKTGRTYWESRPNRIDVKQKAKSAPYLKEGGELIKPMAAYGDMVYNTLENALSSMKRLVKPQNYTLIKNEANRFMVTTNNRAAKFVKQGWEYVSRMSNPLSDKFAYGGVMGYEEGGYMAEGGMEEHGLKIGDTVKSNLFWEDSITVKDKSGSLAKIELDKGKRFEMASGGYTGDVGSEKEYEELVDDIVNLANSKSLEYEATIDLLREREIYSDEFIKGLQDYAEGANYHNIAEACNDILMGKVILKEGGYMAEGGALEHGLQVGDRVMVVKDNIIGVMNEETGEQATIDISTGERKSSSGQSYSSGGTISKSYEPIEGTQYELKVQVYYDKGGMNYFSGRPEARGYYASVSPVQVERRENGIMVESYAAFSGVKQLLVETQRSSPKAEREAMQKAEEVIPQLKAHVIEKLRNKLGN